MIKIIFFFQIIQSASLSAVGFQDIQAAHRLMESTEAGGKLVVRT